MASIFESTRKPTLLYALVFPNHKLRIYLARNFQRHRDHDQKRGAAERKAAHAGKDLK